MTKVFFLAQPESGVRSLVMVVVVVVVAAVMSGDGGGRFWLC